MIPYKISEQERTSIIRPVHHSFNVFHARRGAEGGTLVSPKARLGGRNSESTRQEQYYRDCHHDVPSCLFFFTCAHIRAQDPLTNTFNPYTSRGIRVHVSSEFGPSLFVFTLYLGLFSSSQPSATVSLSLISLHSPLFLRPLLLSRAGGGEETDLPLPPPAKETESRLQTGVVLIKLLKRTCIQGWFRPECSYVQPHATNVRKGRLGAM